MDEKSRTIVGNNCSGDGAVPFSGAASGKTDAGSKETGECDKPNERSNSRVGSGAVAAPAADIGDNGTNKSLTFHRIYLLEEGQLGFNDGDPLSPRHGCVDDGDPLSRRHGCVDEGDPLLRRRENRLFVRIADTMTQIYDDDRDAFFAAVCFFKTLGSFRFSVHN